MLKYFEINNQPSMGFMPVQINDKLYWSFFRRVLNQVQY